jgi:probable phosphoglycerate mutase
MASTAVWSSDLRRAAETAEIIFAGRTAVIRTCRKLREIQLGQWDGVPRSRVRECYPDLWRARGNDLADFRPPGGESFRDLQERVVPQVIKIAEETPEGAFIVTHAGVIRVLVCHFLQMPLSNLFRIHLDYASLSIVSYSSGHIDIHSLNLRPLKFTPGGEFGGKHVPVRV